LNYYGVGLRSSFSNSNTLTGNTMQDNAGVGLIAGLSNNNLFYNNYFDNVQNASASGANTWNITPTPGANVIGGSYLGGNYWGDYAGVDTDWDGLGDTDLPYDAGGDISNGGDYEPLVPISGPVGGIAELPDGFGSAGRSYLTLAALAAAVLVALAAGAWYAKRRRLR
jgi:parallel beta-helix repeat protein